ncbi:hypothetical protein [Bradyrhizobium glycinis]|uniref:hypothetical protein n=1 Tax=Bradyrhizobium glycinis TaxID=2751812 RepID=UPI0018D88753|nr:hypothetical protein [Bradyrhizobium glycinis]MBH5369035.1 hypothetical protein [Bradyrhizobium glycinis]
MPPTTQQVLDDLKAMGEHATIPVGWKSIARAAATEIEKFTAERLKLMRRLRLDGRRKRRVAPLV